MMGVSVGIGRVLWAARSGGATLALIGLLGGCATTPEMAAEPDPILAPFTEAELDGAQWGLAIARPNGRIVLEANADQRFLPASNMKVITTAAALANADALNANAAGTTVRLEPRTDRPVADLALIGGGDPTLGDGPECVTQCIAALADQVAAAGITAVGDVIGDDSLLPPERQVPGWSWDDLQWDYGAPVSALSVNQNTVTLTIAPGDRLGDLARVQWADGDALMTIDNRLVTRADPEPAYAITRPLGASTVTLDGTIAPDAPPRTVQLAIDDPAYRAAQRLARHLEARGIAIEGEIRARHTPVPDQLLRPPSFQARSKAPQTAPAVLTPAALTPASTTPSRPASMLASHETVAALPHAPLLDTLAAVSGDSSNLQAELLLRRLGKLEGEGRTPDGIAVLEAMLTAAGIAPNAYDLADGSGLSVYNRVSPAAMLGLLLWINQQPWGKTWIETQAVGGVSGTLERRFKATILEGKVKAKTGTLFGANTLSGFLETRRGRTLVFSIMVNDRDREARTATPAIDRALIAIAEKY